MPFKIDANTSVTSRNPRPRGRFLPESAADFKARAKNLAWLLQSPLQETQNLLARIYGFSDLHDIQQVLEQMMQGEGGHEPGPYQEYHDALFFSRDPKVQGGAYENGMAFDPLRANYLIEVAANYAGAEIGNPNRQIPQRFSEIINIGLFHSPEGHRGRFRRVKTALNSEEGVFMDPPGGDGSDYFQVGYASDGSVVLAFTRAGAAVHSGLSRLAETFGRDGDWKAYAVALRKIADSHPANPWVHSAELEVLGPSCWQVGWEEDNLSERAWDRDADPGYAQRGPRFAERMLRVARLSIEMFEDVLGGERRKVATYKLVTHVGTDGYDNYAYLASLFWGGIAALNLGQLDLARRWLHANMSAVDGSDSFGARYYLAAANLVAGKGPVGRLFSSKGQDALEYHAGFWSPMCILAEALRDGKDARASKAIRQALFATPYLIRGFDPTFHGADGIRVMSSHEVLAKVQEFLYFTGPFWRRETEIVSRVRAVLDDAVVRSAYVDFHRAHEQGFGSALMEESTANRRRLADWDAKVRLSEAIDGTGVFPVVGAAGLHPA
jgi:hypothetical protein